MDNSPPTDPALLPAMTRRLLRRAVSRGEITLPAVPGMLEEYVRICNELFLTLGVQFSDSEIDHLRGVLRGQLTEAYSHSPRSDIVFSYESPVGLTASYKVRAVWYTLDQAYDNWVETRTPPLFGTEPDARIRTLAAESGDPAAAPVLDIGAGTGRNSLALARRGHPVDAVEMTPKFAEILRGEAAAESLPVRVVERDVFATVADLRRDYRLILLSEVVSDFRGPEQLRGVFELAAQCLAPGGVLVFNVFLARGGYRPDAAARQLGEQCYTSIFTAEEVAGAAAGLPLEQISDESVYDYEKAHAAAGTWPPTSWYENWTSGLDVFDLSREDCPIAMRWLVYRKTV